MIRSMTGFGKSESATDNKKITVEIRTLNSKQLDLSVRMPSVYRSLDLEIRGMAAKILQRGKAEIFVMVEAADGAGGVTINKEMFVQYYGQIRDIGSEYGISLFNEQNNAQLVPAILRLPEVVNNNAESVSENEGKVLLGAVNEALGHLDKFRISEGKILIDDILKRVGSIESLLKEVAPFEEARVEAIKKRIYEGLELVGTKIDSNRLEQEMIFYIEKLDITEEKVRLKNHCDYFREVVASEEAPGRKLGFIAQEMGREINTLGSKANNSDIQRVVVAMKDELEKIKEQLLNIL